MPGGPIGRQVNGKVVIAGWVQPLGSDRLPEETDLTQVIDIVLDHPVERLPLGRPGSWRNVALVMDGAIQLGRGRLLDLRDQTIVGGLQPRNR